MKNGYRIIDSDMHIMEPPDLFDRYLDPKFKDRVSVPIGPEGRPTRGWAAGMIEIDGLLISDADIQQYRKRQRTGPTQIVAEDVVATPVNVVGRGRGSGIDVDWQLWLVTRLREGKIVHARYAESLDAAREQL